MKRILALFLQAFVVFVGMVTLAVLIRLPLLEGRAVNLDLFSIYTDPLILYGYATSGAFFVALYQTFGLLGLMGQNKLVSSKAVGALKAIKYCAIILMILIAAAAIYIRLTHDKEDDPAGFLAICIGTTFVSAIVATAAGVFEKKLRQGIEAR